MRTVLGKVGMTPKGVYNNTTKYVRLDVVTKDGQSYVCIKDCNGINVTNTTYWQLIASKGDMPINGIDYNTEEDKQVFKEAVVEDSKTEMDNYTTEKKEELDAYNADKKTELDEYKTTLETEMSTTKDSLTGEITATATDETNKFNTNAESKTNAFNDNAAEKTTNYNTNAETKLKEYNDNSTTKVEEYNTNATNKVAEFNNNVDSLENELTELAGQMPWNTTEVAESIHIEDSAKYSRNKLDVFGNLEQETREGYNVLNTENLIEQNAFGIDIIKNFNGTININGTSNNKGNVKLLENLNENLSGNYTLIVKLISGSLTGASIRISIGNSLHNNAGSEIGRLLSTVVSLTNNKFIVTGEITDILDNVYMYINTGSAFNLCKFEIYLVKGTYTKDTIPAYEPYGAIPSIDYPSMPVVATGVQKITKIGKNYISTALEDLQQGGLGSSTGDLLTSTTRVCHNKFFEIDYDNVAQNFTFLIEDGYRVALRVYDRNKKYIGILNFTSFLTSLPQEYVGTGVKYIKLIFAKTDNSDITPNDIKDIKVMIAKGTNQSYEQYKAKETFELDLGTTELCKITDTNGNVVAQDRAVYREVDGVKKWQWEKYILKAVMNSKSEFTCNGLKNNTTVDFISPVFKNLPTNVYSPNIEEITRYNYLKPNSTTATNKFRISVSLADLGLEEFTTKAVAEQALKDLIAKKGDAIIYYKTTEPIYEDCTPSQSEVLDKLHKISLEKGVNNIFVESENGVTTELQLAYMQNLQSKLNELEAMIVANASEEV